MRSLHLFAVGSRGEEWSRKGQPHLSFVLAMPWASESEVFKQQLIQLCGGKRIHKSSDKLQRHEKGLCIP